MQVMTIAALIANPRAMIGEMEATTPEEGLGLLRTLIEDAHVSPWEFACLEPAGLLVGRKEPFGRYQLTGVVCPPLNYSREARPCVITALKLLKITSDPQLVEYLIRHNPRGATFLNIDHPGEMPEAM